MRLLIWAVSALALWGCATREVGTVRPAASVSTDGRSAAGCATGKVVWVTIDGTSNTPVSRTAAARLHELVETHSYSPPGHPLAIWYAEGVGSADLDIGGKALGIGVDDDIRKAYGFLTTAWKPGDCLFLNGFSRGAYSVRALGGLLYLAGIPDLSGREVKARDSIVKQLFAAYKGSAPLARRLEKIDAVLVRHGVERASGSHRAAGFSDANTGVVIEAMTIWDSVQALGLPDRSEDPVEGPGDFLITACNVRAIFQPLSLDDNRAYSFTPILAGGSAATAACRAGGPGKQDASRVVRETWFSGAHADVGGTYETTAAILDGELASVSLNWMLQELAGLDCRGCASMLALPVGLVLPEDRLTAVHDGKRTTRAYRGIYRQTRKPSAYWARVYGRDEPLVVHASVIDRLEWLFALDGATAGCDGKPPPGTPILCARELASYGLVPELLKGECLEVGDWGYRLKAGQRCISVVGERLREHPQLPNSCEQQVSAPEGPMRGKVYKGELGDAWGQVVATENILVPIPRCSTVLEAGQGDDGRSNGEHRPHEVGSAAAWRGPSDQSRRT